MTHFEKLSFGSGGNSVLQEFNLTYIVVLIANWFVTGKPCKI